VEPTDVVPLRRKGPWIFVAFRNPSPSTGFEPVYVRSCGKHDDQYTTKNDLHGIGGDRILNRNRNALCSDENARKLLSDGHHCRPNCFLFVDEEPIFASSSVHCH
jgi:hypothetical protein